MKTFLCNLVIDQLEGNVSHTILASLVDLIGSIAKDRKKPDHVLNECRFFKLYMPVQKHASLSHSNRSFMCVVKEFVFHGEFMIKN